MMWRLISWELKSVAGWLKKRPVAKLFVIISFALIIALIVASVFVYSYNIMSYLFIQEQFGLIVGDYILALSFLVVFVVGIVSAAVSNYQTFFRSSGLNFLLSQPIDSRKLFVSKFVQSVIYSSWPIFVILVPVLAAYIISFGAGEMLIGQAAVVIISLGVLISLVGTLISFGIASLGSWVKNYHYMFAGLIVFLLISPLSRFLVPVDLWDAYKSVSLQEFANRIYEMPLFSEFIVTNWVWPIMTGYYGYTLLLAGFIALLSYSLYVLVSDKYKNLLQRNLSMDISDKGMDTAKYPVGPKYLQIIRNDIYELARSSSNVSYLVFILALFTFLINVTYKLPLSDAVSQGWLSFAVGVAWFGYFSLIALVCNKLVFTLMYKEYLSPHLLLTAPLSRSKIYYSKLLTSLLYISIPALLGAYVLVNTGLFIGSAQAAAMVYLLTSIVIMFVNYNLGITNNDAEQDQNDSVINSSQSVLSSIIGFLLIFTAIYMITTQVDRSQLGSFVIINLIVSIIVGIYGYGKFRVIEV